MNSFVEHLNLRYFNGALAPEVLTILASYPAASEQVNNSIEHTFRLMAESGFRAVDFTSVHAQAIAHIYPRSLADCAAGKIVPFTLKNRHRQIDEYIQHNPHRLGSNSLTLLDVGCGFPPYTAMDTADSQPNWRVIGADPLLDSSLLQDADGSYGIFDRKGNLRHVQLAAIGSKTAYEKYTQYGVLQERFRSAFARINPSLPPEENAAEAVAELDGLQLVRNPIARFTRPNLSFRSCGIGEVDVREVDVVRCFNLLPFFDRTFFDKALDWVATVLVDGGLFIWGVDVARTLAARYDVYSKKAGAMRYCEFAFSIDNIRTLVPNTWLVMRTDNCWEKVVLAKLVGCIRANAEYVDRFDRRMDALLSASNLCERNREGYLVRTGEEAPIEGLEIVNQTLDREGFVDEAVRVLRASGLEAWKNCVGHVAVAPSSIARCFGVKDTPPRTLERIRLDEPA